MALNAITTIADMQIVPEKFTQYVTERTTEIGLKKALGAIPWQIQAQFLIESFLLSIIGGTACYMLLVQMVF